jgi:hypothetical protein
MFSKYQLSLSSLPAASHHYSSPWLPSLTITHLHHFHNHHIPLTSSHSPPSRRTPTITHYNSPWTLPSGCLASTTTYCHLPSPTTNTQSFTTIVYHEYHCLPSSSTITHQEHLYYPPSTIAHHRMLPSAITTYHHPPLPTINALSSTMIPYTTLIFQRICSQKLPKYPF